jgi:hypothetical protein
MERAGISSSDSVLMWFVIPVVAWFFFSQIRYFVRQSRAAGWPVIDATLQKGPTGLVSIGRGGLPACFIGYTFRLDSSVYTGLFALYGSREDAERIHANFPAGSIRVRYNPSDPNISYLENLRDPRFGRLTPTQNPGHLKNIPTFDLQDVMRG